MVGTLAQRGPGGVARSCGWYEAISIRPTVTAGAVSGF
jgi:hypothetical protein